LALKKLSGYSPKSRKYLCLPPTKNLLSGVKDIDVLDEVTFNIAEFLADEGI
jgi:hypothetical protein